MSDLKTFTDEYGNKNFYLKMNNDEALALYTVLLSVGGDPKESPRKYISDIHDNISEELHKSTSYINPTLQIFQKNKGGFHDCIYFKDTFETIDEIKGF